MLLPSPWVNVKYGTSFLWNVQYQVAKVAAKTISPSADIKKMPQKKPNTFKAFNQTMNNIILSSTIAFKLKEYCSLHSMLDFDNWFPIITWKYGTIRGLEISLKLHAALLHGPPLYVHS